jgi:ankyrin repeat protein
VNAFSRMPDPVRSTLVLLSQDIHSTILDELKAPSGEKVFESFNQKVEALMPENTFHSNVAISQNQASPIVDLLKLTLYLVSNNFFRTTSTVSGKIYEWIKQCSDIGLMQYLFSVRGPIVEALWENLFRLAIDAQDAPTVKKMMDLGVDPNELVYSNKWGTTRTPLQQACWLRSLKLVRVLINGGAKVDLSAGGNDDESALVDALYRRDANGDLMRCADTELVQILLKAGAVVNPPFGKSPLAQAVKSGHVEAVDLLVSAGADVHFAGKSNGSTPLISAVKCEKYISNRDVVSMARILLKVGADPQAKFRRKGQSATVLQGAMHRKSIELIQLLLNNGAQVTEPAFVRAAKYCDINTAKLLLKFGGQVTETVIANAVQNDDPKLVIFLLESADEKTKIGGKTAALAKALQHGKMDLVDWLKSEGAQLDSNFNPNYAISKAIERGDLHALRLLLHEKPRFRARCIKPMGLTLSKAIKNGQKDIVELLLASGAEVTTTGIFNNKRGTALLAAIRLKDPHLVVKILAAGAPVNSNDFHNDYTFSPLPAVVNWGHYPLIQEMINAGADINAPETSGSKTPLAVAVEKRDSAMIEFLINAGADVNAPSAAILGGTALEAACQNDDLHMVQKLLGLGAESDEWSLVAAVSGSLELVQTLLDARLNRYKRFSKGFGCRALQYAIKLENAAMIEILLTKGINPNTVIRYKNKEEGRDMMIVESALGSAIKTDKSNDLWIVQMLLCRDANPNSIVGPNATALLAAINQINLPLVQMLIAAGADANPSIVLGVKRTPLQLAAEKGHIHIAKLLLTHGADVNAPPYDRYGATALQFAAIGGFVGLASLLLENGADVNAPPAKIGGRTALEGAAEHGRIDMLQFLLSAGAQIIGPGSEQYESARELTLENGHVSARRLLEKHKAEISEGIVPWNPMSMEFGNMDLGSMDLYSINQESTNFGVSDGFRF